MSTNGDKPICKMSPEEFKGFKYKKQREFLDYFRDKNEKRRHKSKAREITRKDVKHRKEKGLEI